MTYLTVTLKELLIFSQTWLSNRELTSSSLRLLSYLNLEKMIITTVAAKVATATAT